MGTDWRPRARACRRRAQRGLRLEKLESRLAMAADLAGLLDAAGGADCQCAACQGLLVAAEAAMAAEPAESSAVGAASLTSLPLLSSNPTAAAKLFLDFDGHFEANWSTRSNLTTPAFDQDGAPNTFSAAELVSIREIWARVAEDYAPFNLDVTTIDPGTPADFVVAVIAIGGSYTDWYGAAAGGVAFNGGFANGSPNVGYVFAQSLGGQTKFVAESAAHEAGHLFGLSHQALWTGTTLTSPYNSGTADWAPIMGSSYYAPRTTWHNGPTSAGPTVNQDEMAIIGSATNRFGYRADDFASSRVTATALPTAGQSVAVAGILERADDQDVWSLTSTGGAIDLELSGAAVGTNLNAVLELVTSEGTVVVRSAPTDSLGARLSTVLAAGNYFVIARSEGDYGNVGQYTLTGTVGPGDQTPPTADIVDVSPDPRNSHAGLLQIAFSEPVSGVDVADFALTRDGLPVALSAALLSGAGRDYTLDLTTATAAAGSYAIRLVAAGAGIRDAAGNALTADAADSWVTDTTAPTADIDDVLPDPRSSSAGQVQLLFSEPVSGFDSGDLSLVRNGTAIALPMGSLTGSGTTYTLDLTSASAAGGSYVLRIVAQGSGIRDGAGNSLQFDAVDSWIVDTTAPEADIVDVTPNPRNGPVPQVAIQFTEPVTGVSLADLALTRNGNGVSLQGAALSGSGATYSLDLSAVSQLAGSYELRLSRGGIADLAGNALASEAIARWSMEQSGPSVGILDIHPDPRNSSVGVVGFQFSEVVTGFDVSDLELVRSGTVVSLAGLAVSGSGSSYTIDLSSVTAAAGSYQLTLVADGADIRDAAGNPLLSGASDSWVMDDALPLVTWSGIGPPFGNRPTATVSIHFSEVVIGVDLADFELRRNGALVSLLQAPWAGSGSQYTVDLTAFNASSGSYELRLVAAGSSIRDTANNPLMTGLAASWVLDVSPPTASFAAVTPNSRATALNQIAVSFSEPVVQFDVADLALFRDGTRLALAAGSVSGSGQNYTVDLSGQTTLAGEYVLQVVAAGSGIQDSAGNLLSSNSQVTWRQDFRGPRAQWGTPPGHVRNQAVETLRLDFDEAVTGVDSGDFSLTRDGSPVPLPAGFLRGAGTGYFLDLASVTGLAGSYVLRLKANSAIVDAAGNALQEEATISWDVDTTAPQAQTQFDVVSTPYLRDAVTRVTITFSEAVGELAAASVELWLDNVRVPWGSGNLAGGSVLTLELGAEALSKGNYRLRIPAEAVRDLAGNAMAVDLVRTWQTSEINPWHNRDNPLDVDGTKGVTARDVLTLINELNARRYSNPQTARLLSLAEVPSGLFFDVNNDQFVTAGDCLALINFLNAFGPKPGLAEGEGAEAPLGSAQAAELPRDLLDLLAMDNQAARSRRPVNRERR